MTADNQGNDLNAVKNVLTSKIIVAPYVAGKTLTASQIAPSVADPITELGDVFGSSSATVGSSPATEHRRTPATATTPPNSTSRATRSTPTRR